MAVFIPLLLIIVLAVFVMLFRRRHNVPTGSEPSNCETDSCGQGGICGADCAKIALKIEIEYYDDEELDAYKGIAADAYTDEQAEQFREVLYTMQSGEVAGWVHSLQLRGVELPTSLKDEVILLIGN